MTDSEKRIKIERYEDLVLKVKKELPNIILPSMGLLDDIKLVNVNGKDYVVNDRVKEE